MKPSVLLALLLLNSTTLNAGDVPWHDGREDGWYWYEDPEPQIDPEPDQPLNPEVPLAAQASAPDDSGPQAMSTAWLRVNLPKYLDAAVDNPTVENVAAYFYLQKVAMDKANAFARAAGIAVTGDYALDENNRRPLATFGNRLMDQETAERKNLLIQSLADFAGIFYFYDDSAYSKAQDKVNAAFASQFSIHITPIAVSPNATTSLPNGKLDGGHAELLGIQSFPAMVLIKPDGEFDIISQSPIALPDMVDRLAYSGYRLGIVDDTSLDSTNHYRQTNAPTLPTDSSSDLPIPPSNILSMMRLQQ